MAASQKQELLIDEKQCVGCRLCQMRCSINHGGASSLSKARLEVTWDAGAYQYRVQQGEKCTACGVCVSYCLYGVLKLA